MPSERLESASFLPVLVVGSGISGLWTALQVAREGLEVVLVTKQDLMESNTRYAQGGIAVAIAGDDGPSLHTADTLAAGAGLCDIEAVDILTHEGPEQLRELLAAGVRFDRGADGSLQTTLEAAHSRRRVIHAGGDATGHEIERALVEQVRAHPAIRTREHAFVVDMWVQDGTCRGAVVLSADGTIEVMQARATVLASGGAGALWLHTTNPATATGDGVALAYRAGAEVIDLEFMQFHPTAFSRPGVSTFLISEAVRGEGAVLRDARGEAFMGRYHPDRELAPRDVVARAIADAMVRDGRDHVHLDASHLPPEVVETRFPSIVAFCRQQGLEPTREAIPVAPAAHYFIGGVKTDYVGRTTVPGLFAVGEAASTGVHGANRLASNSLLEAVVFARRVAGAIASQPAPTRLVGLADPRLGPVGRPDLDVAALRHDLRALMWQHVGLLRDENGLHAALSQVEPWRLEVERACLETLDRPLHELRNMLQTAELVTRAAHWRTECRGTHWRTDGAPSGDPAWSRRFAQSLRVLEPTSIR
jgi:L-aspartate oxidase